MDDTSPQCCVKRVLLHAIVHPAQPWKDRTKPSLSCTWDQKKLPYMLKSTGLSRVCILCPHSVGIFTLQCPSQTTLIITFTEMLEKSGPKWKCYLYCPCEVRHTHHIHVYTMGSVNNGQTYSREGGWYWGTFHPLYTVCKNGGGVLVYMDEANVLLGKHRGRSLWIK